MIAKLTTNFHSTVNRLVIITLALVILAACQNSDTQQKISEPSAPLPAAQTKIKFDHESFDFGVITPGTKVTHEFTFENTGEGPLIITRAQAACGCTVPERPKKPLKPREKGIIKVVYNSEGQYGRQRKLITITSNGVPVKNDVYLIGEVKNADK